MILPISELGDFIAETMRQIKAGVLTARTEGAAICELPAEVEFEVTLIATDGVNAVERTEETTGALETSTTVEPAATQTTTKSPVLSTSTRDATTETTTETRSQTEDQTGRSLQQNSGGSNQVTTREFE